MASENGLPGSDGRNPNDSDLALPGRILDSSGAETRRGNRKEDSGQSVRGRRPKNPDVQRGIPVEGGSVIEELKGIATGRRIAPPDDPEVEEQCRKFWQWATETDAGEGRIRLLPDISLSRVTGGWKLVLKDIETSLCKKGTVQRLEDLARACEAILCDVTIPWEPFQNLKNPKGIDHHPKKSS